MLRSSLGIGVSVKAIVLATLCFGPSQAYAQDTIKVGIIGQFSGMFADVGKRMENGINLHTKLHGDKAGGKKVEVILKDTGGTIGDVAKRLSQELVVRDKVHVLSGYMSTPEAAASIPVANEAKTPMLLMHAATSGLTARSPYVARLSYSLAQVSAPMGTWAAKNGIKKVFTIVADYGPGYDAEKAFNAAFTAAGGEVIGGVKSPLTNLDWAPFLQRAHDAKPDALFVFIPTGQTSTAFLKVYQERELAKSGIKLLSTGDLVNEISMDAMGDAALGVISSHHYSAAHDSPENKAFVKAHEDAYGARPDFFAMQAYDTMAVIYAIAAKLNGNMDGDKFMEALKDFKLNSPRGPLVINAANRDLAQTIYMRKVEKRGNRLDNVEFDQLPSKGD